jgi:uncharacterized protein YkwD
MAALLLQVSMLVPLQGGTWVPTKFILLEYEVIRVTNVERARYGLPALRMDFALQNSAKSQSVGMSVTRLFAHGKHRAAENIAYGQRSVQEVMRDWMKSPGPRANILNPRWRKIGVGVYYSGGTLWWCQHFTP